MSSTSTAKHGRVTKSDSTRLPSIPGYLSRTELIANAIIKPIIEDLISAAVSVTGKKKPNHRGDTANESHIEGWKKNPLAY